MFVSGAVSRLDGARAQGSPLTAAGPCPDPEAGAWAGAAAPAPSTTGCRRARPAADLSAAPGRWRCGEGGQPARLARTCDRFLLSLSVGTRVRVRYRPCCAGSWATGVCRLGCRRGSRTAVR